MAQRLPIPGGDNGTWGDILNGYLEVSHNADGTLANNVVGTGQIQNNAVTNAQLDVPTQTAIAAVANKYVKPGGGIPSTDLSSAVQANLTSASTAVQLGGDLGGTNTSPTVAKIQGTTVSAPSGGTSSFLNASGTWTTPAGGAGGTAGGDLSGTYPNPTVAKINTIALPSSPPVSGNVLTATGAATTAWQTPAAGVMLDSTSTDIAALGTQSAGSTGKAADAGHVHPTTGLVTTTTALGGDLSGTAGNATVARLKGGITLPGTAPSASGQVLTTTSSGASATTAWSTPAAGVTLDTTSTDIQPDTVTGSAVAGSTGKAADAGHQHPLVSHDHSTSSKGGQLNPTTALTTTGTASSSTFLRGDNTWNTPPTASNATTSAPGLVQLAGDLGGTSTTATAPTLAATTNVESIITANTTVAGALQKANNLSDVNDAGTTRANIHVPALTPAACVVTTNVSSLTGLNTYDGYQTVAGDLILLTGQSTASQNGLWTAASGSWTRPTEMGTGVVMKSRTVPIIQGTTYGGSTWLLKTNSSITIDTTSQTWVQQLPGSVVNISSTLDTGAWQASYSYPTATIFTNAVGERRLVIDAYSSGAVYGAADQLNTIRLGPPTLRPVTVLNAQQLGIKFRGAIATPQVPYPTWYQYWGSEFSKSFVQSQIAAAKQIGCNLLSWYWDLTEVNSGASTLAANMANWATALTLAQQAGLYVLCGAIVNGASNFVGTTMQQQEWIQSLAALLHVYPNVIGLGACNEYAASGGETPPTSGQTTQVTTVSGWVSAVTDLPLCWSQSINGQGFLQNAGNGWTTLFAEVGDFLNFHPYYSSGNDMTVSDVETWGIPGAPGYPILLGEVGTTPSGQTNNLTYLPTRINNMQAIIIDVPQVVGACVFALNDYNSTDQWGVFDATGNWNERTTLTGPLRTWPKRANRAVDAIDVTPSGAYSTTLATSLAAVTNSQVLFAAQASDDPAATSNLTSPPTAASAGDAAHRIVAEFTGLTGGDAVTAAMVDADSGVTYATAAVTQAQQGSTPDASTANSPNPMLIFGAATLASSPTSGFGDLIVLPSGGYGEINLTNDAALQSVVGGASPWTIEIMFIRSRTGQQETLIGQWGGNGITGVESWLLYIAANNTLAAGLNVNGTMHYPSSSTTITSTSAENYAALCYDGTNVRMYLNGTNEYTQAAAGITSGEIAAGAGWDPILIGVAGGASLTAPFAGSFEEVRISNTARYTGSTYSVPTSPFTADANTIGLYHADTLPNNVVTQVKTPWFYVAGPAVAQLQVKNATGARGNLLRATKQSVYSGV